MKTAFVFPGQGSQHSGMGKDVAERFDVARDLFNRVDDALGFSISKICFEGSEDELKLTANTQPAILTVSSAMAAVLAANGKRPDMVAGHSLGEYSAIVAAGGLDAAAAAVIVRQRGEFMQEAVPVGTGAMAAVIGPSFEEIKSICDEAAQGDVVSPANINAPGQIVIAGSKEAVERAIAVAKSRGVRRALPLPVSAPFHCALMRPAEQRLAPVLALAEIHDLHAPLVNNVDARPVTAAAEVRDGLIRQVVSSVRWVEVVERMIADGVTRFVEIGPGAVLAGLIKRINGDVETINVKDAETLEAYLNG